MNVVIAMEYRAEIDNYELINVGYRMNCDKIVQLQAEIHDLDRTASA